MPRPVRKAVPSEESRAASLLSESVICVDLHFDAAAESGIVLAGPPSIELPRYDEASGELWFLGVRIKRLKRPADNQEKFLLCWQDQNWQRMLYDPLPPSGEIDPHKRFFVTLESLNRCHLNPGWLIFKPAGGEKAYWCEGPLAIAYLASRGIARGDIAADPVCASAGR